MFGIPKEIWSSVFSIFVLLSTLLLGRKKRSGWLVALALQPLTGYYDVVTGQMGWLIAGIIATVIQAKSWWGWRKEDLNNEQMDSVVLSYSE